MRLDAIGHDHFHTGENFLVNRPDGSGDWLMLLIKSPAIFRIEGKEISISQNSFIVYTGDFPQYYYTDTREFRNDWLHFQPDSAEQELMQKLDIPLNRPVAVSNIRPASDIQKNICIAWYSQSQFRQQYADLNFQILLYKLSELTEKEDMSENMSILSDKEYAPHYLKFSWIRENILRFPGREWRIEQMAAEAGMSASRFMHLYSALFGTTVRQDIIHSRITNASNMLRYTSESVQFIAEMLGYHSISYFRRQFTELTGVSPEEYRESFHN